MTPHWPFDVVRRAVFLPRKLGILQSALRRLPEGRRTTHPTQNHSSSQSVRAKRPAPLSRIHIHHDNDVEFIQARLNRTFMRVP